ncbi:MAG TPA: hypothetical protein DEX20_01205 [Halieaceae bacterium]|nr:hypothetical protein [Halieaceae bacterium]
MRFFFSYSLAVGLFLWGVGVGAFRIPPYEGLYRLSILLGYQQADVPEHVNRALLFEQFSPYVDVVFLGDSLIAGVEWSDIYPGFRVSNRGIPGDDSVTVLSRLGAIVSSKPTKVIIMLGINDIYSGRDVPEILDNYLAIIDKLTSQGIDVSVLSTVQCVKSICGAARVRKINLLNLELSRHVASMGAAFVELQELSSNVGLDPSLSYDGMHLNPAGYLRMSEIIKPHLI